MQGSFAVADLRGGGAAPRREFVRCFALADWPRPEVDKPYLLSSPASMTYVFLP